MGSPPTVGGRNAPPAGRDDEAEHDHGDVHPSDQDADSPALQGSGDESPGIQTHSRAEVEDVPAGVRIIFHTEPAQAAALRGELERWAQRLASGRCTR